MTAIATKMIRIRFDSFREALSEASLHDKSHSVPTETAVEFNRLLEAIGESHSEIKSHLPATIDTTNAHAAMLGLTHVTFLSLEIMLKQIEKMLDLLAGDA